jgi:hypothetical protein
MPNLSLEDLQRQISQQDSELQILRRELEARRTQLGSLAQRKKELQAQLQRVEAQIAAVAGGKGRPVGPASKPSKKKTAKPFATRKPGQPSLASLIVIAVRTASRPLTVKQLAKVAKQQGFKSSSGNFPKLVGKVTYSLKKKGVLKSALNQPGFVLAPSGNGQGPKASAAKPASPATTPKPMAKPAKPAATPIARPVQRVTLREVLTQVLKKSDKPMSGSELAKEALKAGYRTTSKHLADSVWTALGNMDNVENVKGEGYRLKKSKS